MRIPVTLHKALKRRALEEDKSLGELIRTELGARHTHDSAAARKGKGVVVGGKKIETFADLAKLATPMGGDASSNIDALVYGDYRRRR
ncbi:MAG: hypothetical protein U1C18_02355 [Patescibacteria group bacterium]|nr:hypothetical protein [Patescibacteria group bacterium]